MSAVKTKATRFSSDPTELAGRCALVTGSTQGMGEAIVVVRQVLAAIEEGREEVLVDEVTRKVKRGMVAEPPSYVRA